MRELEHGDKVWATCHTMIKAWSAYSEAKHAHRQALFEDWHRRLEIVKASGDQSLIDQMVIEGKELIEQAP